MLSPRVWRGRGRGVIDSASFYLGGDFDIWVLPWRWEFDQATILEDQKNM